MARFSRDALAKQIYSKIFDWIVVQINKALKTSGKGKVFSIVKLSSVISTTFKFSRQKQDTKLRENSAMQSIANLK